ncbi:hypothetical protein AVEN_112318-1 [Araneus ventricosus]|uniref:Uncharacterized protein n=1 Tax=Araneus ventricosus TaxID=182803 RepID=A0A4Y2NTQ1_ARAVE|nr:hypothetical protein AVEN_22436-1 [Araneus ventricosus]GBN42499.1 hypothetical protein AVEN_112318-1 [Araneus ventricosus]
MLTQNPKLLNGYNLAPNVVIGIVPDFGPKLSTGSPSVGLCIRVHVNTFTLKRNGLDKSNLVRGRVAKLVRQYPIFASIHQKEGVQNAYLALLIIV